MMVRRSIVKSCRFTASICRLITPCTVVADPQYVVSGRTLKMFQLPTNHGRADYPVHKTTWLNSSHKSRGTDVFISWHQGLQDLKPDECCLEKVLFAHLINGFIKKIKIETGNSRRLWFLDSSTLESYVKAPYGHTHQRFQGSVDMASSVVASGS